MSSRIAFNSANLVGRVTGGKFVLKNWGQQHTKTAEQTDEKEWAKICSEVAAAGYHAIEVWVAHVDPAHMTDARATAYRKIMADHGLQAIGLAGTLNDDHARVCHQLNIPVCNGGLWNTDLRNVRRVMKETGVNYNFENHGEKSVDDILDAMNGGAGGVGVAVDTGWLGTHGLDAPSVIRELGDLVTHVHLKDVKHKGGHETCPLGTGVVNIAGSIQTLKEMGYAGWYSWEDEPEDRNPMDIAQAMREWIEEQLRS